MKIRTSFFFNLAIVGTVVALLTIPGEAKQPPNGFSTPQQSTFGLFLDPQVEPVLLIKLAHDLRSF